MGIQGPPHIGVIEFGIGSQYFYALPTLALVPAFPQRNLAAGAPMLGAWFRRTEDSPHISLNPKLAHVVVVGRSGHFMEIPRGAIPMDDRPNSRFASRPGHVMGGGEDQDHGISIGVELNVF